MTTDVIIALIIAFSVSAILGPVGIPLLRRLKVGQQVRENGPQSHLEKSGTPTMGGIMILLAVVISCLFFVRSNPALLPVLFVTLGFGLIGFIDDYIKIIRRHSEGLNPIEKILLQLVVSLIFCIYLISAEECGTEIILPFSGGKTATLPIWLYVPFVLLVMIGTDNGVNFTDGLDGLCSGVTVVVAAFFTVCALMAGSGIAPVTAAVAGALLGFLLYNVHPAHVFMGDTGSLALGGFVAATALVLKMPLFILIVGLVYLIEVLSVILQVGYFKVSHGKRLFKMAPIHHHFELCGWSETQVDTVFAAATVILCLIGILAL